MASLRDFAVEIRKLTSSAMGGEITADADDISDRISDLVDALDVIAEALEHLDSGLRGMVS